MFREISNRYDLLNHIITFGFDIVWRRLVANRIILRGVILDLCCGAGELISLLSRDVDSKSFLVGLDFTEDMLKRAQRRRETKEGKAHKRIDFVLADAKRLPFKDSSIDCICMSFSFRNLTFKNTEASTYIEEILRVLKAKGRFIFIETGQPQSRFVRRILHIYLERIMPMIGGAISGCKGAYRYLSTSVINFPQANKIGNLLKEAGFLKVSIKPVTLGVVTLFECSK